MRKVAVVGTGITKFGQRWDRRFVDLTTEAIVHALTDAQLSHSAVESLYLGTMSGGLFTQQEHLGSMVADHGGFTAIPGIRVEAACASGGVALRQAYLAIASGVHDVVMVVGAEKMTDVSTAGAAGVLATAADTERESMFGATFPGIYAMIAQLHMHRYDTTEEHMAHVSVKNHTNAVHNPHAQFRTPISVEQVLDSPKIADPLKLLDASPLTDGAAAVVLVNEERARKLDTPVWIAGSGQASDCISLHDRRDLLTLQASVTAGKQAFHQARLQPKDIGIAEVHDCFTIAELLALEDLGFVEKGASGPFIEDGGAAIGGTIPVNTSGGLKAKGHPVGASGVAQVVEAAAQLRGEAGKRNTGAETAVVHNVGGSGGTAAVHVLRR